MYDGIMNEQTKECIDTTILVEKKNVCMVNTIWSKERKILEYKDIPCLLNFISVFPVSLEVMGKRAFSSSLTNTGVDLSSFVAVTMMLACFN